MTPEPGEDVFFHGHPSWLSMPALYVKGLIGSLFIGVVAGLASALASGRVQSIWVILAVLAIFVAVSIKGYARRMRTTYMITDRRLTIGTGLFSRDVLETRLERIQNVNSHQTVLERLLGVGTVDFDTAAGADYDFRFKGVEGPRELARTVERMLHERHALARSR